MGTTVLSRRYLTRQASALIEFAKSIKNPELAAVLVERAADFKEKADEKKPAFDSGPRAPDVEPSPGWTSKGRPGWWPLSLQHLQNRFVFWKRLLSERWPVLSRPWLASRHAVRRAASLPKPDEADGRFLKQQEIDMEREINLLSNNELNAVVGGRINLANPRPRVLPSGSVSAGSPYAGKVEAATLAGIFVEACIFVALWWALRGRLGWRPHSLQHLQNLFVFAERGSRDVALRLTVQPKRKLNDGDNHPLTRSMVPFDLENGSQWAMACCEPAVTCLTARCPARA
jgi:hypothetical protein